MTYFGIASADNFVQTPVDVQTDGTPVFFWPHRFGFIIVLEGRPGRANRAVGTFGTVGREARGSSRANVQVLADRALGNGSSAVCDVGPFPEEPIGGVPGVNPLEFDSSQSITDALNDFACRFDVHNTRDTTCTFDARGNFAFASPNAGPQTVQFCSAPVVGRELAFSSGDTTLIARLVDVSGNIGDPAKIVVRIP